MASTDRLVYNYQKYIRWNYKLKFAFDYFVQRKGPNVNNGKEFCEYLLKNYISLVQVEVSTKSVLR
jgi:hypothetical protein